MGRQGFDGGAESRDKGIPLSLPRRKTLDDQMQFHKSGIFRVITLCTNSKNYRLRCPIFKIRFFYGLKHCKNK